MTPARYPGRCSCGAAVKVGDLVTFAQGYKVNGRLVIELCPTCRPVLRRGAEIGIGDRHVATVLLRGDGSVYGVSIASTAFDSFGRAWVRVRVDGDAAEVDKWGPEWGGEGDDFPLWAAGVALRLDGEVFRRAA